MPDAHDEVTARGGAPVLALLAGTAAAGALLSAAAHAGSTLELSSDGGMTLPDWVVFLAPALDITNLLVLLVAALLLSWSLPRPDPVLGALGLVGGAGLVLNATALLLVITRDRSPDPFGHSPEAWSDLGVVAAALATLGVAALLMWVGSPPRRRAERP